MIFDAYFLYSIATTILVGLLTYVLGRSDGYHDGLKHGEKAISDVNKALDEMLLGIADEKKTEMEDFGKGPDAADVGKGTEITELPKTAIQEHENIWKDYKKFVLSEDNPVVEKPKSKPKKAAMKPKRKKGKK
jgi:hypothetical protein